MTKLSYQVWPYTYMHDFRPTRQHVHAVKLVMHALHVPCVSLFVYHMPCMVGSSRHIILLIPLHWRLLCLNTLIYTLTRPLYIFYACERARVRPRRVQLMIYVSPIQDLMGQAYVFIWYDISWLYIKAN